jgi:hypothetical protein
MSVEFGPELLSRKSPTRMDLVCVVCGRPGTCVVTTIEDILCSGPHGPEKAGCVFRRVVYCEADKPTA